MYLFKNMRDPNNKRLRKLSAKLLCKLVHNNCIAQQYICDNFGFTPLSGRICINTIPEYIKELIRSDPKVVKEIREGNGNVKGALYWTYPPYCKEDHIKELEDTSIDFPDPLNYLIGCYSQEVKKKRVTFSKLRQSAETSVQSSHGVRISSLNSRNSRTFSDSREQNNTRSWHESFLIEKKSFKQNITNEIRKDKKHLESVIEEETPKKILAATINNTSVKRKIIGIESLKEKREGRQRWGMTRIGKQLEKEVKGRVSSARARKKETKTRKSQVVSGDNTRRTRATTKESLDLKNLKRLSNL